MMTSGTFAKRVKTASAPLLAAMCLAFPATPSSAQSYPSKQITLLVAFAPGGVADSVGRLIGQKLGEQLGQTVVVENRGGAGGNIAAKFVAGAAKDGHTLLITTTALAINETLYKNKGFAAADFQPIAIVATSPESLSTSPENPGDNLATFFDVKRGKPITFGTAGVGSGSHIAAEYLFTSILKVPAVHVPFQGGAPAINAAVGNQIGLLALTLGGGVASQIAGGKLKGLGVASEKRVAVTPDVPTYAEGGFPNFTAASWVGVFAPAGVSSEIVRKLNETIDGIVKQADIDQRLRALGFEPVQGTQADAAKLFGDEVATWGRMVRAIGLSIE
jgi:tripartite-type tricarboxylate transporter receptor subunit TctC